MPDQQLKRCPRCSGYSVIYPATNKRKYTRSQSYHHISIRDKPIIYSEYAVCQNKHCCYKFCTNCLRDQHLDSKCSLRPLGSSPTSDDDASRIKEEFQHSKRNLRRLSRLPF